MKKYLPKTPIAAIKSLRLRTAPQIELPNIYRFITEKLISIEAMTTVKIVVVAGVTAALVLAIFFQAYTLYSNLQYIEQAKSERGKLLKELVYWKQMADQYQGYRDVYFRIASLEYTLGNIDEARKYIEKALQVDPNFEAGRVLGAKVGLK